MKRAMRNSKKPKPKKVSAEGARQSRFLELVRKQMVVRDIARDGDCLFAAFAAGLSKKSGIHKTVKELRVEVADFLVKSEGNVPGLLYDQFVKKPDGSIVTDPSASVQVVRNMQCGELTLEQYANAVRSDFYGGDMELTVLAHLFQISIHVYTYHTFHDSDVFSPQCFHYAGSAHCVSLLFEEDCESVCGGRDHYDFIAFDRFKKWRDAMRAMPEWKKDIGPCTDLRGRGVEAYRDFDENDIMMWYDGHRVDESGKLVFERPAVTKIFQKYTFNPESLGFHDTHALRLGRRQSMNVLIDGYPLTLQLFDDEPFIGRGALANSASPQDANMTMIWLEAPDLPEDSIDNIRSCESILVARRKIRYIFVTCIHE